MFELLTATSAWAEGEAGGGGLGSLISGPLPMLVLMFAVFYFLLIRPQQKKAKQHKEMLGNLRKGDTILTTGGLYGKITGLTDSVAVLEIAPQVRVKVSRGHIAGVASGDAPSPAPAADKAEKK